MELAEDDALTLEGAVGEISSVSGRRPVEATKVELAGDDDLTLEGAVGCGSLIGIPPPVEATK